MPTAFRANGFIKDERSRSVDLLDIGSKRNMQRPVFLVSVVLAFFARHSIEQARALPMSEQELVSNACTLTENQTVFDQFIYDTTERHSVFEDTSKGSSLVRAGPRSATIIYDLRFAT